MMMMVATTHVSKATSFDTFYSQVSYIVHSMADLNIGPRQMSEKTYERN